MSTFQGLSLALSSQDQFEASDWSTPPPPPLWTESNLKLHSFGKLPNPERPEKLSNELVLKTDLNLLTCLFFK